MIATDMLASAEKAAEFLKLLGHRHRLLILCHLLERERSVGDLCAFLGARESNVSQHLALLRRDGLVRTRREGQTIWYSIASEPARAVLDVLYQAFCGTAEVPPGARRSTPRDPATT